MADGLSNRGTGAPQVGVAASVEGATTKNHTRISQNTEFNGRCFVVTRLSFSWMKESRRRTKQCLRNLPRLRAGRKWNCRRPSELSPRLAAGGVHRAFAAGGLHRGGNPMPGVSSHFSHHVGSGANLHGVFA